MFPYASPCLSALSWLMCDRQLIAKRFEFIGDRSRYLREPTCVFPKILRPGLL